MTLYSYKFIIIILKSFLIYYKFIISFNFNNLLYNIYKKKIKNSLKTGLNR
jgi:hypothetical protein